MTSTASPGKHAGGHRIRVTPVPIPNTEVKPDTADGTACAGVWESRSLPGVILQEPVSSIDEAGFFFVHSLHDHARQRLR